MGADPEMAEQMMINPLHHEIQIRNEEDGADLRLLDPSPPHVLESSGVDIKAMATAALGEGMRLEKVRKGEELTGDGTRVPLSSSSPSTSGMMTGDRGEAIGEHRMGNGADKSETPEWPINTIATLAPIKEVNVPEQPPDQSRLQMNHQNIGQSSHQPPTSVNEKLPSINSFAGQVGTGTYMIPYTNLPHRMLIHFPDYGQLNGPSSSPTIKTTANTTSMILSNGYYHHPTSDILQPMRYPHQGGLPISPTSPRPSVPPQYQPVDPALDGASYTNFYGPQKPAITPSTDYPTPQESNLSDPSPLSSSEISGHTPRTLEGASPESRQAGQQLHIFQPGQVGAPIAPMGTYHGPTNPGTNMSHIPVNGIPILGSVGSYNRHSGQVSMMPNDPRIRQQNGQQAVDYPCPEKGCTVSPFPTQYLLK